MSINIHDDNFNLDEAVEYFISEIEKCSRNNNAEIKSKESELSKNER